MRPFVEVLGKGKPINMQTDERDRYTVRSGIVGYNGEEISDTITKTEFRGNERNQSAKKRAEAFAKLEQERLEKLLQSSTSSVQKKGGK